MNSACLESLDLWKVGYGTRDESGAIGRGEDSPKRIGGRAKHLIWRWTILGIAEARKDPGSGGLRTSSEGVVEHRRLESGMLEKVGRSTLR